MSTEQCPQTCYAAYARISNVALDGTVVIFTQPMPDPRKDGFRSSSEWAAGILRLNFTWVALGDFDAHET